MSKKSTDHTRRPLPKVGRYDADLWAEMTVLPGTRAPYRVQVWWWDPRTWFNADGSPNGWCEVGSVSHACYGIPFRFERNFKSAYKAAEYIGRVRSFADAPIIADRAANARESARTRVA